MLDCEDCKFRRHDVEVVVFYRPSQERKNEIASSFIKDFCVLRFEPVLAPQYKLGCGAGKPKEN